MTRFMTWTPEMPLNDTFRAVALGVFDGLHIGHRAVISAAVAVRHPHTPSLYLTACVLSLNGVPKKGARLTCPVEREILCDGLGVDEWLDLPFDTVRELSPEAFVQEILHTRLHAKVVTCGEDYRFGKGGVGTADTLKALGEQLGITVHIVPTVIKDGAPVSATRIRCALADGDMDTVTRMQGRPFTLSLPVRHGNRLGHTLGFPTINQRLDSGRAVPRFGVYASMALVGHRAYYAVTNVGVHPTVGGTECPQAETWIADFDDEIYGETVTVELVHFLRKEMAFSSVEALQTQITADRNEALRYLTGEANPERRAILFDFDDTLQDCMAGFRKACEQMVHHHMSDVNEAEKTAFVEYMMQHCNAGYLIYPLWLSVMAEKGHWENVSSPQTLAHEFARAFSSATTLFEDATETLLTLQQRGLLVGVITNGMRLQQNRKLDVCGYRSLLDAILVSGDVGIRKPSADIFRLAAARLGVSPHNCIFVGDNPKNDIEGSLNAGMHAVYIRKGSFAAPPIQVPCIDDVSDILTMV